MKTTIEIQNLKCGGCANTIKKKLGSLQFVKQLEIDLENNTLIFDGLPPADLITIHRKLSQMGYPVVDDDNSLGKKAKSFVSCALGRIQK